MSVVGGGKAVSLTLTEGDQTVRSSELAPTRIPGGVPVREPRRVSAEWVNSLRASVPDQSGQRSCSMKKERRVEESG